jgi:hypothetical protein
VLVGPVGKGGGCGRWLVSYVGRVRNNGPPILSYPRLDIIPALGRAGLLGRLGCDEITALRTYVEVDCVLIPTLHVVYFDVCYDIRMCNVDLAQIGKENSQLSVPRSAQSASKAAHLFPLAPWAVCVRAWCEALTTIQHKAPPLR